MTNIINVIETETNNGPVFSVAYEDGTIEEFTNDNMPETLEDFIYYAKEFNGTFEKRKHDTIYFRA